MNNRANYLLHQTESAPRHDEIERIRNRPKSETHRDPDPPALVTRLSAARTADLRSENAPAGSGRTDAIVSQCRWYENSIRPLLAACPQIVRTRPLASGESFTYRQTENARSRARCRRSLWDFSSHRWLGSTCRLAAYTIQRAIPDIRPLHRLSGVDHLCE
jgi:hypothetical protein